MVLRADRRPTGAPPTTDGIDRLRRRRRRRSADRGTVAAAPDHVSHADYAATGVSRRWLVGTLTEERATYTGHWGRVGQAGRWQMETVCHLGEARPLDEDGSVRRVGISGAESWNPDMWEVRHVGELVKDS